MGFKRRFGRALCCVLLTVLSTCAIAQEAAKDQAKCYTTWDESFFYASFRVDCPDVRGTHTAPNAAVSGDDAITLFVEASDRRSAKCNPACFSLTVSAAGGAQFMVGTDKESMEPKPVWSFKYGATVQGTINNDDDVDLGYTIEMAIPWELMNHKAPAVGDMISMNVLVSRHDAKANLISLSPKVSGPSDAAIPSKWPSVVLAAYSFGAMMPGTDKMISPKSIARPPLINGTIGDQEWANNSSFAIDLPMPPGFVYEAKYPVQRMLLAPYYYWYQADPRRVAPYQSILDKSGSMALQDFPAKNAGPWFSYDRVQWHKEQLADAVAAGIDIVLPVYRGDKASKAAYASKGLDCLVAALAELKTEGKACPMVGMFFDTSSLATALGKQPVMTDEDAKRAFYGMIKDFHDRVPAEYRAFAQAGKPYAGRPANIVYLSGGAGMSGFSAEVLSYCTEKFLADFGCPLVWVAGDGFSADAKGFDAVCDLASGQSAVYDADSRIRTGSLTAGSSELAKAELAILARMNGDLYQKQWDDILGRKLQWVFCNGWNSFFAGSELCASREYGRKYIDSTSVNAKRFTEAQDIDVQYTRCDVPRVIAPKQIAHAEVVLRNSGTLPWRVSEGYGLAYRWYKNGRYFSDSKVRRPLDRDVPPGGSVTFTIGVATVNMQGAAMAEGDCELRFELIRLADNKWLSALGVQPLIVPVTIGQTTEWKVSYISCDAPVMMACGQDYRTIVRVRNEGTETWPKGVVKLRCKLYKVSNYTGDLTDSAEEVPTKDVRTLLTRPCKPGETAEFAIFVNLAQPDGKPLPSWSQSDAWSYQLRFDMFNGKSWLSELGSQTLNRVVDLFEGDYGPRIVDSSVPEKITAGQVFDAKVVIRNTGKAVWSRKTAKIGYHWFHLDGTQMQWDCAATPIAADIKPGQPSVVNAKVKAPEYDGQYVLTWDVMIGDTWLSTLPLSRGGDMLPEFVEVTGGKLQFADLSGLCDVNAISPETSMNAGDFDGKGGSFPSELVAPDVSVNEIGSRVYPSGYQYDREARAEGRISFLYPDKLPGTRSAIACNGQKVTVEHGKYLVCHVLGASTNGKATGECSLNYTDGAVSAALAMTDWTTGPAEGDVVGCMARHRHSHGGDEPGKAAWLYHYKIVLDANRSLTSITLPKNADMKVVAVTLERAAVPAAPAAEEAPKP